MFILENSVEDLGSLTGILIGAGVIGIACFTLWVCVLVDIFRKPDFAWERAGKNKIVSALLVFFFGFIGMIYYWFSARPAVSRYIVGARH